MYSQKNYAEILSFLSSHGLRLQEISKSSQNITTGREKCLCCDRIGSVSRTAVRDPVHALVHNGWEEATLRGSAYILISTISSASIF